WKQFATAVTRYSPRATRAGVGSNLRSVTLRILGPKTTCQPTIEMPPITTTTISTSSQNRILPTLMLICDEPPRSGGGCYHSEHERGRQRMIPLPPVKDEEPIPTRLPRLGWLPIVIASALVTIGSGCGFLPTSEARDKWTKSYPLTANGTFEVKNTNG